MPPGVISTIWKSTELCGIFLSENYKDLKITKFPIFSKPWSIFMKFPDFSRFSRLCGNPVHSSQLPISHNCSHCIVSVILWGESQVFNVYTINDVICCSGVGHLKQWLSCWLSHLARFYLYRTSAILNSIHLGLQYKATSDTGFIQGSQVGYEMMRN